eukprot:s2896_g16.t1
MLEGMDAVHVHASAPLNPLSRAAEAALETQCMQGHVPYDPRCTICARGKSTFQHRRRREGALETEVQADFGSLTTRGEMVDDEAEGTIKVLGFTELSTNCVGYVEVEHEARHVKTQICKWLDHFGLASSTSSESGMNAPGIRHNADCKRKGAAFEAENLPVIPPMPEVVHESRLVS